MSDDGSTVYEFDVPFYALGRVTAKSENEARAKLRRILLANWSDDQPRVAVQRLSHNGEKATVDVWADVQGVVHENNGPMELVDMWNVPQEADDE